MGLAFVVAGWLLGVAAAAFSGAEEAAGVAAAGLLYSTYGYGAVTVLSALLTLGGSAMLFAFVPEPERPS